jgi:hypothetical protein
MQPFHVKPAWTVSLNHPATRVTSTPDAKRIAIASDAPLISLAGVGQSRIQSVRLTKPAGHLAISSDGDVLAVVNASHTLQLLGLGAGTFGYELARLDEPVHDVCEFSRDQAMLWSVGLVSNDVAEIRCYETPTLRVISKHQFQLPIGQCGFLLTVHPQQDVLGLWACGGPDEIWNYWIRIADDAIELRHEPELDGCTPPCFNTRGDRFVVLEGYDLLAFSFPECGMLYDPMTSEDEDDSWAERMTYLNSAGDDHVLATTNESRLFIVGLEQAKVIAEVYLEGHEPKPCYEVYRSLSKTDDGLCTDLHSFISVGSDIILSTHTNGRASNRQDAVLLWNKPQL